MTYPFRARSRGKRYILLMSRPSLCVWLDFCRFFMQLLLTSLFPNHANYCLFMIIVSYECKIIKLISPICLWGDHLMDQIDQSVVENDNEQNIFSCLVHNSFDFMTNLSQHVNIGPTLSRQRPPWLESVHNRDPRKFYDSCFGNCITPRSISYTIRMHGSNTVPTLTDTSPQIYHWT